MREYEGRQRGKVSREGPAAHGSVAGDESVQVRGPLIIDSVEIFWGIFGLALGYFLDIFEG